jgi:steroid 5-alpha reductase family enzyme
MFLFVLSASGFDSSRGYWTVTGMVFMILLFALISIPMMEKRNTSRKVGYTEYVKKVPSLIPRIGKFPQKSQK